MQLEESVKNYIALDFLKKLLNLSMRKNIYKKLYVQYHTFWLEELCINIYIYIFHVATYLTFEF